MNIKSLLSKDKVILLAILVIGFCFRLYNINSPIADFHSWRQADTAAVGRNFIKYGFDLFHPYYDDLSPAQSGIDNPKGYRFVEFPLYSAIFAFFAKLVPIFSLDIWARLISIFFSLVIISVIYYLCLHEISRLTAIIASLTYAIFPAFVFFSRVVLPETTAVSFALLAVFFLYLHTKKGSLVYLLFSALLFCCGLLVKPTVIFYFVAIFYLLIKKYGFLLLKQWQFYLYLLIAFVPLLLWRLYIQQYPEGIPASNWLFTNVNTYEGQKNIFFKPAFFRWIFLERINIMIFGGYLTTFFVLGLLNKHKSFLAYCLLFSAFSYLFVFQGGNVQHEYYQTLILPPLAMFVGIGLNFFEKNLKKLVNTLILVPLIVGLFILAFLFSYYRVIDYYHVPNDLIHIAEIIRTLTKEEDKIITDRMGDTTLLYLSNRRGAPVLYTSLEELKSKNYQYFLTDKKDYVTKLKIENKYQVVYEDNQFALFKL